MEVDDSVGIHHCERDGSQKDLHEVASAVEGSLDDDVEIRDGPDGA